MQNQNKTVGGLKAPVMRPKTPKGGLESGEVCRICLDDEDTTTAGAENPFITPCGCTGSMRFIHVSCVREWLDGKK